MKLLVSPGMARSGTTYSYHSLVNKSNEVFFNKSKSKELNIFSRTKSGEGISSFYNTHDDGKYYIDYSPSYFLGKRDEIKKIVDFSKKHQVKVVLHLRNPVDQMYAHYMHDIKSHISVRQFGDNVEYSFFSEKSLNKYAVMRKEMISQLIEGIGIDNIMVINFYTDLKQPDVMKKKFSEFLDIPLNDFLGHRVGVGGYLPYYVYGGDCGRDIVIGENIYNISPKTLLLVNGKESCKWENVDEKLASSLIEQSSSWTRNIDSTQFNALYNYFKNDWEGALELLNENPEDYNVHQTLSANIAPSGKFVSDILSLKGNILTPLLRV